jgi:1-acyl-sn-glycerol-3-phosphate acyltransferase
LDPPVLNAVFPEPLIFVAKEELFKVPIFGKLISHMGAIPVKRGAGEVLPVYIDGTDMVMPRGKSFPKPGAKIRVFIGKPKDYSHEKNYKEVAIKIMEEIKALSHF